MIKIVLTFEDSGLLKTLTSQGHANRAKGLLSEACAGVSVLLRTSARLFSHHPTVKVRGEAKGPGHLILLVEDVPEGCREWFQGAQDLLILGLRDLAEEYPDSIEIKIE